MNKKYIYIIVTFAVLAFITGRYLLTSDSLNEIKKDKNARIIKMQKAIQGRNIDSLKTIVKKEPGKSVIFYYSGTDCGSCIVKGFKLAKQILSDIPLPPLYVIASNANIGQNQLNNDFTNHIFSDNRDLIRENLSFVATPIMFLINKNNKIEASYFILPSRDEENFKEFFSYLKTIK